MGRGGGGVATPWPDRHAEPVCPTGPRDPSRGPVRGAPEGERKVLVKQMISRKFPAEFLTRKFSRATRV